MTKEGPFPFKFRCKRDHYLQLLNQKFLISFGAICALHGSSLKCTGTDSNPCTGCLKNVPYFKP